MSPAGSGERGLRGSEGPCSQHHGRRLTGRLTDRGGRCPQTASAELCGIARPGGALGRFCPTSCPHTRRGTRGPEERPSAQTLQSAGGLNPACATATDGGTACRAEPFSPHLDVHSSRCKHASLSLLEETEAPRSQVPCSIRGHCGRKRAAALSPDPRRCWRSPATPTAAPGGPSPPPPSSGVPRG